MKVAEKYLEDMEVGGDEVKTNMSKVFATIHQSVVTVSRRMLFEMKLVNYVTPTNAHCCCSLDNIIWITVYRVYLEPIS